MTTREKITAAIHSWVYREGSKVLADDITQIVESELKSAARAAYCKGASHLPSLEKIPRVLRGAPWQAMDNRAWDDGTQMLVAVPICNRAEKPDGDWHYEFSVVVLRCDVDYFSVTCEGEPWGWDLSDVDWFLEFR